MVEVHFPEAPLPDCAVQWFEIWENVRDAPDLKLVGPATSAGSPVVVLLAACIAIRRERGLPVESHWPLPETSSPRVALLGGAIAKFPVGTHATREPAGDQLIGSISSLTYARVAADALEKALSSSLTSASPSALRMARFVFEELGANVVQHSGRAKTGFGWADIEPSNARFQLAFADCGDGFRASLERNPELHGRVQDDGEALQLALTPRISGTAEARKNMGWGLKALVDFADLLDGTLYLASGSAMLVRKTVAKERTSTVRSIPSWRGSWICLDARFPT